MSKELSSNAIFWLEFLGNFQPTANVQHKSIKGWMIDRDAVGVESVYLDSENLRTIANALNETANWLEDRVREYAP